jgi:antitoxin HigA-1
MKSKSSTTTRSRNDHPGVPVHPGSILRRELTARGLSANALARAIRVDSARVVMILNGKRGITGETALRLGQFLGTGPQLWMNLQAKYDLALAFRDKGAQIAEEVHEMA